MTTLLEMIKAIHATGGDDLLFKGDVPGHEFHGNQYSVYAIRDTTYAPNRPSDRPFKLISYKEPHGIATPAGAKPKFSDMTQYFASPKAAGEWAAKNGYGYMGEVSRTNNPWKK